MSPLAIYLFSAMQTFVPFSEHLGQESVETTQERYEAFAENIAFAVSQPYVLPLFAGEDGRAKTGLLLVAIAADESHYRDDVLFCKKLHGPWNGDHGTSFGPFQTTRNSKRTCMATIGAVGVALEMAKESFTICRGPNPLWWLAEYTDGLQWLTERAQKRSARKMGRTIKYWATKPFSN